MFLNINLKIYLFMENSLIKINGTKSSALEILF